MNRFFYFISILLISGSLAAQNLAMNSIAPIHFNSLDSVKVRTNYADRSDFHFKSALLPVSLVTAGVIIESLPSQTFFSKERDQMRVQDRINGFRTKADNYLQFVPVAALFSFKLAGMKSRSDLLNQAIISAKSEFLMLAIVNSMKHFIHDTRPDGSGDNSMPSGHTAQAFVSATLLDMGIPRYFALDQCRRLSVCHRNRPFPCDQQPPLGLGCADRGRNWHCFSKSCLPDPPLSLG